MKTRFKSVGLGILLCLYSVAAHAAISPLSFTVNMSENVTVNTAGGTPTIAIDVGGVARTATYVSGSGTNTLTFTYTPTLGDVDLDGITVSSPVVLNGGTIKDSAGNDATLTFTSPNTSGVKINYPSLGMDFVYDADGRYTLNGTAYNDLPSFLTATGGTFTRNSIGTYYDSTGTLQTASANTPRFDFDPVTHTAKGILIEESRTNLAIQSSNLSNWVIGANSTFNGPSGTIFGIPAFSFTSNGNSNSFLRNDIAISTNTTYSFSFLIDSLPTSGNSQIFLLGGSGGASSYTYTNLGGGIYKGTTTFNSGNNTSVRCHIGPYDANAGTTFRVAAPQLEQGSFPTSYIPTTTAAVTREADVLSLPTSGWFNVNGGSATSISKSSGMSSSTWPGVFDFYNSSSLRFGYMYDLNGTNMVLTKRFGSTPIATAGSSLSGVLVKSGTTFNNSGLRLSVNNSAVAADNTVGFPTGITSLRIGRFDNYLNGYIQSFRYYPNSISDTQLQLMTQ